MWMSQERAKLRWIRLEPRESAETAVASPGPESRLGPCQHFFEALNIIITAAPTSCPVPLVRKARLGFNQGGLSIPRVSELA